MRILFVAVVSLFLTSLSCQMRSQTHSVYLFVFEKLPTDQIDCSGANPFPADSEILCQEFVRFSHAFTPSSSVEVALASLFTGMSPRDLRFSDPRRQHLSNEFETIASAWSQSHATAFFIGGPPLTRRHNLQKGFEVFDDQYPVTGEPVGKSLLTLQQSFQAWESNVSADTQFVTFFVPQTIAKASALNELDQFLRHLKKRKRWARSEIVVLGLGGHASDMDNLRSEQTQVGLFWKKTHLQKEQASSFQRDENVSLQDVGTTFLSRKKLWQPGSGLTGLSLDPLLDQITSTANIDRLVVSESPKGQIALRMGEWLYLSENGGRFFHTLTDRSEIAPLPADESSLRFFQGKISPYLYRIEPQSTSGRDPGSFELLQAGRWKDLLKWSQKHQDPWGVYVAQKKLDPKKKPSLGRIPECLENPTVCLDPELRKVLSGMKSPLEIEKRAAQKMISFSQLDRKLWQIDQKLGMPWIVASLPSQNATPLEYYLSL